MGATRFAARWRAGSERFISPLVR